MELVVLIILILLGLGAFVIIGKLFLWALHNNTPGVLLFFVVPLLAYIAYKL